MKLPIYDLRFTSVAGARTALSASSRRQAAKSNIQRHRLADKAVRAPAIPK